MANKKFIYIYALCCIFILGISSFVNDDGSTLISIAIAQIFTFLGFATYTLLHRKSFSVLFLALIASLMSIAAPIIFLYFKYMLYHFIN